MRPKTSHWATLTKRIILLSTAALATASLFLVVHANPKPAPIVKEIKLGNAKPGTL